MHDSMYCRSILSTPGARTDRYSSARRAGADVALLDLEASVALPDKATARHAAAAFLTTSGNASRFAVRMNALCDPEGLADLLAIRTFPRRPDILVIPMVESPRDLEIVDRVLGSAAADVQLMAIIETAPGMLNAAAIATASPRLAALIFGLADFSTAIHSAMSWESQLPYRAHVVSTARAAGIEVIDAPTFEFHDLDQLATDARRARDMGFSGKWAIHPAQIPTINEVFSPDAATIRRARAIVTEWEASAGNICVVDGRMVGPPMVTKARQILERFSHARAPSASD